MLLLPEKSTLTTEDAFSEIRQKRIAEMAYSLAECRNFEPGAELDDWLAAEHLTDLCS